MIHSIVHESDLMNWLNMNNLTKIYRILKISQQILQFYTADFVN